MITSALFLDGRLVAIETLKDFDGKSQKQLVEKVERLQLRVES